MMATRMRLVCFAFSAMATWSSSYGAPPVAAPLTEVGEKLQARYAGMLTELKADIGNAVPTVDEQKKSAFLAAREDVKKAKAAVGAAQKPLDEIQAARALVDHANGKWIGGANTGIAEAEAALKMATTDDEREAAKNDLEKWQKNKEDGLKALVERQAVLDAALADEAKHIQAGKDAQSALDEAEANELQAAKAILADLAPILSSDKLDAPLVKCAVLVNATPKGLAEFAQQGKAQEELVEKLLGRHRPDAGDA